MENQEKKKKLLLVIFLALMVGMTIFTLTRLEQEYEVTIPPNELADIIDNTINANSLTMALTYDDINPDVPSRNQIFCFREDLIKIEYYDYDFNGGFVSEQLFIENLNSDEVYGYYQDVLEEWIKHLITEEEILSELEQTFNEHNPLNFIQENLEYFEQENGVYTWLNEETKVPIFNQQLDPTVTEELDTSTYRPLKELMIEFQVNNNYVSEINFNLIWENTIGELTEETIVIAISDVNKTNVTLPTAIMERENTDLDPEVRFDLMKHLLTYDAFAIFNYDEPTEISAAFLTLYLNKWGENAEFTANEITFLEENYNTDNWYQLGDYGEITEYVPLSEINDYFKAATNQSLTDFDSEGCVEYIPELEAFIVVCGHGMVVGDVDSLLFGDEGSQWIHYVETKTTLENNRIMLTVVNYYDLTDFHNDHEPIRIMSDYQIIENLIFKNIQHRKFRQSDDNIYYLMTQINDDLYFVARSDIPFN